MLTSSLKRNVAVALFLTLMAAAADASELREIVFPEAAALCVGLWLMPKAVWNIRGWQIPLYLTAAASIGLALNLWLPACFEIRFAFAFVLVIGLLRLVRCNMYPAVSAAMLPVLINTSSWLYPVCVLVISTLLALGRGWLRQEERPEYHPFGGGQLALLTVAVCLPLVVTHCAPIPTMRFLAVPPLVVTMIEFANRRSGFRERPWTIWGLIVAAATLGTLTSLLFHHRWGLPMAVGTFVTVPLMLLLFRRFKPFAPALAIAIVPALLPCEALPWFPLLAALGGGWFILAGMLLPKWMPSGKA